MKVFVYETLKKQKILEEALGEKHGKKMVPDRLVDYEEVYKGEWPTIEPTYVGEVKGDLIEVNAEELNKLDKWESRYRRIQVRMSNSGIWAYAYQFKG